VIGHSSRFQLFITFPLPNMVRFPDEESNIFFFFFFWILFPL